MSLETLLEAAKYLEYHSEAKARGEDPPDYDTYAQISGDFDSNSRSEDSNLASKYPLSDDSKERRRAGGAGTREVHNKLEKNRRAHLKECFETLKRQIPNMDDKKTSNLSILRSALRYIQSLKRKERDHEHELEQLAREKITLQQHFTSLKKEISSKIEVDVKHFLHDTNNDSNSTSTASECGPLSDDEEEVSQSRTAILLSTPPPVLLATQSTLATLSTVAANTQPMPTLISTVKNCSSELTSAIGTSTAAATTVTIKPVLSTVSCQPNARLTQSVAQAMFPIGTQTVNSMVVHPVQMIASNATIKMATQLSNAKTVPVVVSKSNSQFLQKPIIATVTANTNQARGQTVTIAQLPVKVSSSAIAGLATMVNKNNIHSTPVTGRSKPVAQILQQTITQRAMQMSVQGQVAALIKTPTNNSTAKSITPLPSQTIGTLSGVTHLVTNQQLLPNVNHIVSASPVASIMGPVTMVSAANHATQLLPQSQISKILNQPVMKAQIPIVQQQFLQSSGTTQSVKPVVVVTMPNVPSATTPSVQVSVPVTH